MDVESGEFIEGPCRCVNKVLEQFGVKTVSEMFENRINKTEQISLSDTDLMITEKNDLLQKEIFVGRRIGLSDKYPSFKDKLYRFVIYENKIKKEKKTLLRLCDIIHEEVLKKIDILELTKKPLFSDDNLIIIPKNKLPLEVETGELIVFHKKKTIKKFTPKIEDVITYGEDLLNAIK